jgi:excisionase family DNA binding protein
MATKSTKNPPTNGQPMTSASLDILTLQEAAEFLRVSAEGLSKDASEGHAPAQRVAGEWRFSKAALLAWFTAPSKPRPGSKEAVLSVAGLWKDDPTVDDMIKDIYERRRKNAVAGD